jgi:hypothetical protein
MPEMRGFGSAPGFFLFNEKLLFLAMRIDDMRSESSSHNHRAFLLFLKETQSRQECKSPLVYQQKRERVENSGLSIP